ncbi:putative nuclease s1 protein [Botrytis fragariae]|uniref:Putative nuclease s1 protein n=1 Tax=Botrytis fragariae TaxID=1964551 RepID=A0A8H6EJ40_9HELO|nr:putative nuclease s1 protein [Botrytis fragariae]KAF5874097.1 putative nuclease s1 protein [Botrytis fragariae]
MKVQTSAALLLSSWVPATYAWGTLGHYTVAYVATNFVSTATKTYFQGILGDTTTDYLATVATWPDSYRYTTAGAFSAPFHYIDAQDSPPTSCGVSYSRDCGTTGCIVSAIQNYTTILQKGTASAANLDIAAKMIIHFLGDIHQPLHDENLDVGGNTIAVTYAGATTNLHSIWDTAIPEQYTGGYALSDAKTWAATLTTAIKTGTYSSLKAGWTEDIDIDDPVTSSMVWASDSNAYVCSTVLPKGVTAVETGDLSTNGYYTAAIPVVKLQIAKAGYRLAAWLDLIATGTTNL